MYSYTNSRGEQAWARPEYAMADAQVRAAAMQQPGVFAKNFADNFGAYVSGLNNNTTAQANFFGNLASQAGLAQAANAAALGNIGTAALAGFGGASQGAFDAWKGNQQSYNSALAGMHAADQRAVTGAGALGALSGLNMGFGGGADGGGFNASGPGGQLASGSFGGTGGGGGGMSLGGGGNSQQAMQNAMALSQSGAKRLDDQHFSSRMMPSQMLDQSLAGFAGLGQQAYDNSRMGMNQFYGFLNQTAGRPDFTSPLAMLQSGYRNADSQVNNLWNNSLGKTEFFKSPLEVAQDQWALEDARAERDSRAREARGGAWTPLPVGMGFSKAQARQGVNTNWRR
jgi:hypothetical protein